LQLLWNILVYGGAVVMVPAAIFGLTSITSNDRRNRYYYIRLNK